MATKIPKFNPLFLVSWGLKFAIFASTIWLIMIGLYAWAFNAALVSALVVFPNILAYKTKAKIPWPFDFLLSSAMAIHILGFSLKLYPSIPHYDVLAHFVSAAFIGMMVFSGLMIIQYHSTKIKLSPRIMMLIIIMATITAGVIWEWYEWGNDIILFAGSPHEQWSVADTMKDLIINAFAGTFIALVGITWTNHTPRYKLKDAFNHPKLAKWLSNKL